MKNILRMSWGSVCLHNVKLLIYVLYLSNIFIESLLLKFILELGMPIGLVDILAQTIIKVCISTHHIKGPRKDSSLLQYIVT